MCECIYVYVQEYKYVWTCLYGFRCVHAFFRYVGIVDATFCLVLLWKNQTWDLGSLHVL